MNKKNYKVILHEDNTELFLQNDIKETSCILKCDYSDNNAIDFSSIIKFIDWEFLSKNICEVDVNFVRTYKNKLNWKLISENTVLSDEFLLEFIDDINWNAFIRVKRDKETVLKYIHLIDFDDVIHYKKIDESIIYENAHKIKNWSRVFIDQNVSEEFIERFIHENKNMYKYFWYDVSTFQNLSENFIEKYADMVHWVSISKNELSEKFMETHKDKLSWYDISLLKNLSVEFIKRNIKYINKSIIHNEKISKEAMDAYLQSTKG